MSTRLGDFPRRMLAGICSHGWLAPGARCVVAVSGGPDSTALAAALAEISASGELGLELALAHFDHAIRPDSARDAEWVAELAVRLGADFLTERADVPALARREGLGIEEAARNARLDFLERAARRFGAGRVATGHTADDQAETVLFRILRGTGIKGLAGIPPVRPISRESPDVLLIRPILGLARAEVLAYLAGRGLDFLTDPTNRDIASQARARIRHEVLPSLERTAAERWKGKAPEADGHPPSTLHHPPSTVRSALLSLAASAAAVQESLAFAAARLLEGAEIGPGQARLPLGLLELPAALRAEVLALAAERMGAALPIPRGGLARAADVLARTSTGARAEARGLVAERGYDCVVLQRVGSPQRRRERGDVAENGRSSPGPLSSGWSIPVAIPGETGLPAGRLIARIVERREFDLASHVKSKTPLTEVFDARLFQLPGHQDTRHNRCCPRNTHNGSATSASLCALCGERNLVCRTRRPGDRFRPFGSAGAKKLKAFLIDRKLPRAERDGLPLLAVEGGGWKVEGSETAVQRPSTIHLPPSTILWAVGQRLSEAARVPPDAERLVIIEYVPDDAGRP